MIHLRNRWTALFLALVLSLSLALPASAAQEDRAQAAHEAAQYAMQYGGAVSVQYALWENGEVTLQGHDGVYSKTENRALTDDDLYGIGSISKTYTAAAMMKLVEQGKVDLDEPVTAYLPDFTMADPRYTQITVRMLLNHSSGLMGGTTNDAFLFGDQGNDDAPSRLLERLAGQTLQAEPGAYSVYSNDSFTLAQLVIERVSGMEYTAFLNQYLLEPLGLENTLTPMEEFDTSRLVKTYLGTDTRALPAENLTIVGTGGIYSTASDLAAFGGALCGEGLLSQASLDEMASDQYLLGMWPEDSDGDAVAYGLGWDSVHMFPFSQNGIQALVKGGDTIVYHAGLVILPEYDMAAAVLTSGGISTYNQLAAARILLDALAEQGVEVEEEAALTPAQPAQMPAELTQLSGWYGTSTAAAQLQITDEGVLTLTGMEGTFTYREDGSFRDESDSVLLKLVQEDNGETYLYQKSYASIPGLTTLCVASYAMERLPSSQPDEATQAAWEAREGKMYVQTNERWSSAYYALSGVFAAVTLQGSPEGYLLTNQLTAPDTAAPVLQIPGTGSRDSAVIRVLDVDGCETLELNGSLYQDASSVSPIFSGPESWCIIRPGQTARWYRTGEAAGSQMTVEVPENGGFYVYDAALGLQASSWLYGDTTVVLPENGWIVFSGEEGAQFHIYLSQP